MPPMSQVWPQPVLNAIRTDTSIGSNRLSRDRNETRNSGDTGCEANLEKGRLWSAQAIRLKLCPGPASGGLWATHVCGVDPAETLRYSRRRLDRGCPL